MATINGNANNNTLIGTDQNDTINGMAGNDLIQGLAGNDIIDGGTGVDAADYREMTLGITVTLNGSTDALTRAPVVALTFCPRNCEDFHVLE